MNDVNLQDRLANMQETWNETETPEGGGGLPPDGDYQAKVERYDLVESEYSQNIQLLTELKIVSGEYSGRTVKTWHDLEDPEKLEWAKGHLRSLGLDPDQVDLGQILAHVEPTLDKVVDIRIKSKPKKNGEGVYTNVYVNRVLGKYDGGGGSDVPVDKTDLEDEGNGEGEDIKF